MGDGNAFFKMVEDKEKNLKQPWYVRWAIWCKEHWKNGKIMVTLYRFGGPKK